MVNETVDGESLRPAVFRTITQVDVTEPTVVHTFLHSQVKHGFFFTIVNICYTCEITLALVSLDFINHVGWDVLHGHVGVIEEELLTIHKNLGNLFTVDGYTTIFIYLYTWEFLYESLQCRTFWHTIGISVIHDRVAAHLYRSNIGGYRHVLDHLGIRNDVYVTHADVLVLLVGQVQRHHLGLEAHVGDLQGILAGLHIFNAETTIKTCCGTSNHAAVGKVEDTDCG